MLCGFDYVDIAHVDPENEFLTENSKFPAEKTGIMDLEPGEVVDLEPEQVELLTDFLKKREEDSGKPIGLEELKDWETEVLDQFQKTMEHAKKITGWSEEEILNQADELISKAKEIVELEKEAPPPP